MWIFKIEVKPPPPVMDDGFDGEFQPRPRQHYAYVVAHDIDTALHVAIMNKRYPLWREEGCKFERVHPINYSGVIEQEPLYISDRAKRCRTMYKSIADITGQRFKDSHNKSRL